MNRKLVGIGIIVAALFWPQLKGLVPGVKPAPGPNVPVVTEPDADARLAVEPVKLLLANQPTRGVWREYWLEFGDTVRLRPEGFKSVGDIIKQHEIASDLYYDLYPNKVGGLTAATEQAIKGLLGDDDKAITQAQAERFTNAMAWACGQ